MDLPATLAFLVGLCLIVYVIAAGYDLGIGLFTLVAPRARDRAAMFATLETVAAGQAIWLVLAAFVLASAFPSGRAVLEGLWPFWSILLVALVIRSAAFVLHRRAARLSRGLARACEVGFGLLSGVAILCQGLVIGVIAAGWSATGRVVGWDLILAALCAAGLLGAYGLLAAGWLIWRGEGATRVFGREVGHAAAILLAGATVLSCGWAVLTGAAVAHRWHGFPGIAIPLVLAIAVAILAAWTWRRLWSGPDWGTFARAAALVLCLSAGLTASLWPDLAVGERLIGAASGDALRFTAFDVLLAAPILLAALIHAVHLLRARPAAPAEAMTGRAPVTGARASALTTNLHLN